MLDVIYKHLEQGKDIILVLPDMERVIKTFNTVIDHYDYVDRHNFTDKLIVCKSGGSLRLVSNVLPNSGRGRICNVLVVPTDVSEYTWECVKPCIEGTNGLHIEYNSETMEITSSVYIG